jgi:hypothetical protein
MERSFQVLPPEFIPSLSSPRPIRASIFDKKMTAIPFLNEAL